jgi:Xaa-Pro aminopeptidase
MTAGRVDSAAVDLRRIMRRHRVPAFYSENVRNVRYLTGFTGSSAFVLVTEDEKVFVTDFRYEEQSGKEVLGWDVVIQRGKRIDTLRTLVKQLGIVALGFDSSLPFESYELLGTLKIGLTPVKGAVERLRRAKSSGEVESIRRAVERAEHSFLAIRPRIRAGVSEREISLRLEAELKRNGCRAVPFDIIVASGRNSSMPHAKPTDRKIERGDLVTIDWGGESDGYYADMTRTLLVSGGESAKKVAIYQVVNGAREKAIQAVRPGAKAKQIDAAARTAITDAGYGVYFGHGTGHGVGLEVHEAPYISRTSTDVITEGSVFTIEPGIYIPDLGGVRIEDMVIVRDEGAELLTSLSRELHNIE